MDNTSRRSSAVKEANNMHSNPKVQYITQSEYYTNENDPKSTNKFELNKDQVPYNTSFKNPINIRSVAHINGHENEQPSSRRETQAVETLYWAETEKDTGRSMPVNSLDIKKNEPVYRTTTKFVEKSFKVDDQFYHGSAVVQSVNQGESPRSPYSPYSSGLSGNGLVHENSRPTLQPGTSSMKDSRFQGRQMNTTEVPSKQTVPQRGVNSNTSYQPTRDGTAYGYGAYPSHISPSRDQQLYYSTSRNTNTNEVEPRPTQDSNVNALVGIPPNQSASSRAGEQQLYFHQDNSTDVNITVAEPHRGNNTTSYVPVPLRDDFSVQANNRNASGRPTVRESQLVDTNPFNARTRVGPNCTTFEPESDEHNQTYQSRSPTNTRPQFEYNNQHDASRPSYHRPVDPHIHENIDINRFQTLTDDYVIHENNAIYSGSPTAREQQVFYNHSVNTRLHPIGPPVPNYNNNNQSCRPTRNEQFHVNNMQLKVPITYANNRRNTAASNGPRMEPEIRNRIHSHHPNQYLNVYNNSDIRDSRNIYQNRHENASVQIDNGYQCMYNNPALVADASFGQSAYVKSLDYVQPCYDEYGHYPPSTDGFPYEHLVYPSSALNRHEPPYAVPPTDVYYCETTTSSKKKKTRMGVPTEDSDGGGDDSASASIYHNRPLVMAHTVSEGEMSEADGDCSSFKTKNGRVKCSCGKTMKFSVSVKENTIKDNCVACFKKLKQDFRDLLGAYKNQGFQPCKCKDKLSVTDLASAYMSGNRPECTHQDDFVQVHTCEVKGGGVLPPAQSDSIPTIGDVHLKGCKCSDKMKTYKLPSNMASCNCGGGGGGGGGGAAAVNCGCGASGGGGGGEKGGGGGKCGSDEESSACSPCSNSAPSNPPPSTPPPPSDPPPSTPPPSKPPRSKGKPSDAPRSRAPRAGGAAGIRYEKVTMYPTSDDGSNQFLEPVEKTSSCSSHKKTATGKKHSMKRDKVPNLSESDRSLHPPNLPRKSSSHSSYNKGRRYTKIKGGRISAVGLYAVPSVATKTPFEQASSTKILRKKKKKVKNSPDEKPIKKRDKKQDRGRSNDGDARSDDSTMCEKLSSRIAGLVSSADIRSRRRKEVVVETMKAPGVLKGGSARLPDHKQKRTRTLFGNPTL